jgi:hypothetical protein
MNLAASLVFRYSNVGVLVIAGKLPGEHDAGPFQFTIECEIQTTVRETQVRILLAQLAEGQTRR